MSDPTEKRASIFDALYLADGVTLVIDAAREAGVNEATLRARLKRGESPCEAVRPVVKQPNGYERGEYSQRYDVSFRPRMGLALRAAERALNSQAKWRSVLCEAQMQRDACIASLTHMHALVASAQAELSEAVLLLQAADPKDCRFVGGDNSSSNIVRRRLDCREALNEAERQAKGAADRLLVAEKKVSRAAEALRKYGESLPVLLAEALPFSQWVKPERNPLFASYLAARVNHEPQ